MTRIFNHTKQYAVTEVFRLEELQKKSVQLEESGEIEDPITFRTGRQLQKEMLEASRDINEFIANLKEQEKQK